MNPTAPHYVYIVEVIGYGRDYPIKIGIAADVKKRMRGLGAVGIHCPRLVGWFELPSRKDVLRVETATRHHFAHLRDDSYPSREVFKVDLEDIVWFAAFTARRPFKPYRAAA